MGLTQVSTDGVKNDAITKTKIPANQIEASELADNAVDTNAIADQAVALSKLPHGDGSSNGKFLRANNGADPTFESLPASGVTVSNNTNNRVVTGDGTNLNAEANLTFDGTTLKITDTELAEASDNFSINLQAGNNDFYVKSNGTSFARFRGQNGDVHLNTGNLIIGTAGKGIDFSASGDTSATGASMSSEVLDEYEEGSWTPTWNMGSGSTGNQFSWGRYVKIGAFVHCMFALSFGSNGLNGSSGEAGLGGLPFACQSPNASGPRGGTGSLALGYGAPSSVRLIVVNGTTGRFMLNDSSFLQHNTSGINTGYNSCQLSGSFTYNIAI